jgi:hypothetical protein
MAAARRAGRGAQCAPVAGRWPVMAAPTMPAADIPVIVERPGVYDLPDHVYHADPVPVGSLSSSGARKLLPPSCPARFRWDQQHPPQPKRVFDIGHAAHKLVLGAGPDIVEVTAADWRTKAAQVDRDAIRAAGAVPLLTHEYVQVQGMADALSRHPVAAALFDPTAGSPEQSLFWVDDETGVWCRARLDWLPRPRHGRLIVPDYKTCVSAEPGHIQRAVHNYGYHQQAAFYLDGVQALDLADTAAFVFVLQEKVPPYLVTVAQIDETAEQIGRELNRRAIDIYRRCAAADHWPSYSEDVALISLPTWAEARHNEELTEGTTTP